MTHYIRTLNGIAVRRGTGSAPVAASTLTQEQITGVENTVFTAQGLLDQAWSTLNQVAQAGLEEPEVKARELSLQRLGQMVSDLNTQARSVTSDTELAAWKLRADALVSDIRSELVANVNLQKQTTDSNRYAGLFWGLGVATAVAVVGFVVWKKRKR